MRSYELNDRLRGVFIPSGYYQKWNRLAAVADEEEAALILSALDGVSQTQSDIIVAAICDGPTKGQGIFGVGGWLTRECIDFARFAIAVAPVAAVIMKAKQDHWDPWKYDYLISAMRFCHETVGRYVHEADRSGGKYDSYRTLAAATMLCYGANGRWKLQDADYIASHYEGLEPYFEFIVRSEDSAQSQLNMLLTTKPVVPLSEGLL